MHEISLAPNRSLKMVEISELKSIEAKSLLAVDYTTPQKFPSSHLPKGKSMIPFKAGYRGLQAQIASREAAEAKQIDVCFEAIRKRDFELHCAQFLLEIRASGVI